MFKLLVTVAIGGMLLLMGIQFVPVYVQNHAVKKVAQDVISQDDLKTKKAIVNRFNELFRLNDINQDPKEILNVVRQDGKWIVDVKYEERRKLMYNMELVAAFDDQISN